VGALTVGSSRDAHPLLSSLFISQPPSLPHISFPFPHTPTQVAGLGYKNLMVCLLDNHPTVSDGSKGVLATAAGVMSPGAKLTVFVNMKKETAEYRKSAVERCLSELGVSAYTLVERAEDERAAQETVLLGDTADANECDLLVISSEHVHSKRVDANLLAEFVSVPILLLP
jgi:hypothetical protein